MKEKEYTCAYPNCLHKGEKVSSEESVIIGKKHYHWDCAQIKREIQDCAELYVNRCGDKTLYPTVIRIINNMVFKSKVPVEYIRKQIETYGQYYASKPVFILYGIRKLYWEKE